MERQVTITNVQNNTRTVLSIKSSKLWRYVDKIRREVNSNEFPEEHKKFEHLPLLGIRDMFNNESWTFPEKKDLPKVTLKNSKGEAVLIIIPESEERGGITVNYKPLKVGEKSSRKFKHKYAGLSEGSGE